MNTTDRYTKIVLTVIAIALVLNVLTSIDLMPKAHADIPNDTRNVDRYDNDDIYRKVKRIESAVSTIETKVRTIEHNTFGYQCSICP